VFMAYCLSTGEILFIRIYKDIHINNLMPRLRMRGAVPSTPPSIRLHVVVLG
jgi:hypothetical protein